MPPVMGKDAPSRPQAKRGDGCSGTLVVNAQGYAVGEPVIGRVELEKRRLTLSTVTLADGKRALYKGTLTTSLCERDPLSALDVSGTLSAPSTPKALLSFTLTRNDYFANDRERLHLEASDPDTAGFALKLWETPAGGVPLRDAYQKALGSADDVEVVLESSKQTLLVGSLDLESRRVTISELSKEPLAFKRRSDTGRACEGEMCGLELSAFEVSAELTVLIVVTASETCGAKCSQFTEGQVWTLGPDRFVQGASLPGTDRMPGGINYEGRSSHTHLCWTEADGAPPLEILAVHTDSEKEDATVSVVGFDPDTRTYSRTEEQPPLPRDGYPQYCGSPLGEF